MKKALGYFLILSPIIAFLFLSIEPWKNWGGFFISLMAAIAITAMIVVGIYLTRE